MGERIKVIDIHIDRPVETIPVLEGYQKIRALARLHGTPLGYVENAVIDGGWKAANINHLIFNQLHLRIVQHLLNDGLQMIPKPGGLRPEDLVDAPHPQITAGLPAVSVAVCTRDRTTNLEGCLNSLVRLEYPALEIIVVDNAPSDAATERLVRMNYPQIRYVCEPHPGLDWARNRAISEAHGEIIAFTDDDVIVDPGWVSAFVHIFVNDPQVMAVTGLVVPHELETEAQILFEKSGGFGRGFERRWYRVNQRGGREWEYRGSGNYGTGANMAYRKQVFDETGPFDPALDVGTATNGGGDLDMFFRVLKHGYTLVYEPSALVRHIHRRTYEQLKSQLRDNQTGLFSYFIRASQAYPEERVAFFSLGVWWLGWWLFRRLLITFIWPDYFPRDLIWAEIRGAFIGLTSYSHARRIAKEILPSMPLSFNGERKTGHSPAGPGYQNKAPVPEFAFDLNEPIQVPRHVELYARIRISARFGEYPVGSFDLYNFYRPVSALQLKDEIVKNLMHRLLKHARPMSTDLVWTDFIQMVRKRYFTAGRQNYLQPLPENVPVTIIVGTFNRPADLHNCLQSILAQKTNRRVEILVIDNNPPSGLTFPVVAQFPGVKYVREFRKGIAYARNAGILASSGEIIVITDDDVIAPSDWLENLIAHFNRPEVMAVTGNVLPLQLETDSQHLFEIYGGLGRGILCRELGKDWFHSFRGRAVPTWELGGTANAAFRAAIFQDPDVGLMDEALGPGMPSGVGEDTYCFYKILKAGHRIIYEPSAYVWHNHRQTMSALRRQIYNYSKGHVSYHLTTLFRDGDLRVIPQLFIHLPIAHISRAVKRLLRKSSYTLLFLSIEILGNIVGPIALLHSHLLVKRLGRSGPEG